MAVEISFLLAGCQPQAEVQPIVLQTAIGTQVAVPETVREMPEKSKPLIQCIYTDQTRFQRSMEMARNYTTPAADLTAGVVPHHLVADREIAGFFQAVSATQSYDTVVILAPSHYLVPNMAVTTTSSWNAHNGIVESDLNFSKRLIDHPIIAAADDGKSLERDHGVAGLIPYVRACFPDAKVTVCLLSNRLSQDRLDALLREIFALSEEKKILLLGSIDFSHYLQPDEAAKYDAQTMDILETGQWKRLRGLDDKNMDSPKTLELLIRYNETKGASLRIWDHTESYDLLGVSPQSPELWEGITTHFILGWEKENNS